MNKKHGLCCIILGAMLLIAALSLVFYNSQQNKKSGEAAQEVLTKLKDAIPEPAVTDQPAFTFPENDLFSEYETETTAQDIPVEDETMMVDENGYIGYITLPDLGIELPVMSQWSYPDLKISPCRYKGTLGGGDLIVAAHNYNSHFGRLKEYSGGETIYFTAADGTVRKYEIVQIEEINGRDIEAMDFGSGENWDLTLFTCTLGGQSRVTVRAVEIKGSKNLST
ncbi:MAG: sortase [Ruminococcus sp.]|nr:sortase [Ruminococcus sp.]